MSGSCCENKIIILDTSLVSGDKGSIVIGDNEVSISVNTSSCYRIVVYKLDSNIY